MTTDRHIIHCINTSVNCDSSNLLRVNDVDLGTLVQSAVEELENELDAHGHGRQVYFAEMNLDVEVSAKDLHSLKDKVKSKLLVQLHRNEQQVQDLDDEKVATLTEALNWMESFLFFLKTGNIPWNGQKISLSEVLKESVHEKLENAESILQVLRDYPGSLKRLVYQHSTDEILTLILLTTTREVAFAISTLAAEIVKSAKKYSGIYDLGYRLVLLLLEEIIREIARDSQFMLEKSVLINFIKKSKSEYPDVEWMVFEEAIIEAGLPLGPSLPEELKDLTTKQIKSKDQWIENDQNNRQLNDVSAVDSNPSVLDHPSGNNEPMANNSASNTGMHVYNAGIILLHPFLPSFFEKVGLVEKGKFISRSCRQRAVGLLHYIATGELLFEEHLLHFQKFLCDHPENESIPKGLPISRYEKDEVEKLLNAVIDHWNSLKGVSIAGLRGNYFTRSGVLQLEGDKPIIHVERKTADILLKGLPWTLSIAKLPWLDNFLTIKWS